MRRADHGHIGHLGVGYQQVLHFLWIDVDPARDDHEALAVGEVEKPLFVEPAYIPQRRPAVLVFGLGGLVRIVVILELAATREKHLAFDTGRDGVAVFVADLDLAIHRAPDRALVRQPLHGIVDSEAVAFGPGVIFMHDRPPPADDGFLDRYGAGRGGVEHPLQA